MENPVISYPFGAIDTQDVAYDLAVEVKVSNQKTMIETGELEDDMTISVVAGNDLAAGAELIIGFRAGAESKTVHLGSGFKSRTIPVGNGAEKYASFIYNGSAFILLAAN